MHFCPCREMCCLQEIQLTKGKKKDPTVQYLHLEAGPVFGPQNQLKKKIHIGNDPVL